MNESSVLRPELNPTKNRNAEFSINCVGCSAIGDLSFSGGCNGDLCVEDWAPDANFSMLPFDFTEYWLGVAFDDFKIHIELDINLTPTQPTNEIIIPLLGSNGLDIPFMVSHVSLGSSTPLPLPYMIMLTINKKKGRIFDTDFNFNPQIHGWVNSTSPAHFNYGFDFVVRSQNADIHDAC